MNCDGGEAGQGAKKEMLATDTTSMNLKTIKDVCQLAGAHAQVLCW